MPDEQFEGVVHADAGAEVGVDGGGVRMALDEVVFAESFVGHDERTSGE